MRDIIIVGGGTAGLTAAIYALRAGKSAAVIEGTALGGQIINTPEIENYPGIASISGFDFAMGLADQAKALGAEVISARVDRVEKNGDAFEVTAGGEKYEARAVILATGAKNRPLGIAREQELIGRGISYCATCDGMFFRGRDVAVNGGGNTALEDAAFLANYCNKVYLIHRRDEFRGEAKAAEALRARENVEFVLNSTVKELIGEESLEAVDVVNKNSGEVRRLDVAGLFVAIGQMPSNEAFAELADLDEKGYLASGEDCATKTPGLFAAGDARTKEVRQLTTAASDGAVAALAACRYIDSAV